MLGFLPQRQFIQVKNDIKTGDLAEYDIKLLHVLLSISWVFITAWTYTLKVAKYHHLNSE